MTSLTTKKVFLGSASAQEDKSFAMIKGRHLLKKVTYFRALPEWGGGFTDAQIFGPFFTK